MIPSKKRPDSCEYDHMRRCMKMSWGDNVGYYHVRGGIAWPRLFGTTSSREFRGFAVVILHDVISNISYVHEQFQFKSIDNITHSDSKFEKGFMFFYAEALKYYGCNTFFQKSDKTTKKKYYNQIAKSCRKSGVRIPVLIDVNWDDELIELDYNEAIALKKVRYYSNTTLVSEIKLDRENNIKGPAVQAFSCALSGMVKNPYNKPKASPYINDDNAFKFFNS